MEEDYGAFIEDRRAEILQRVDAVSYTHLDVYKRQIMVSRYLDRIAAISIDAAFRIAFLLTGQRWSLKIREELFSAHFHESGYSPHPVLLSFCPSDVSCHASSAEA